MFPPRHKLVDLFLLCYSAAMSEWKPIETYPGGWALIVRAIKKRETGYNFPRQAFESDGRWLTFDLIEIGHRPTHWMPLPKPPTEAA